MKTVNRTAARPTRRPGTPPAPPPDPAPAAADRPFLRALLAEDGAWDLYDGAFEALESAGSAGYADERARHVGCLVLIEARRALLEKAGLGPGDWDRRPG